jgi:hypothetical protein
MSAQVEPNRGLNGMNDHAANNTDDSWSDVSDRPGDMYQEDYYRHAQHSSGRPDESGKGNEHSRSSGPSGRRHQNSSYQHSYPPGYVYNGYGSHSPSNYTSQQAPFYPIYYLGSASHNYMQQDVRRAPSRPNSRQSSYSMQYEEWPAKHDSYNRHSQRPSHNGAPPSNGYEPRPPRTDRRKPLVAHSQVSTAPPPSSTARAAPASTKQKPSQHRHWEVDELDKAVTKTILDTLRVKTLAGFKELEKNLSELRYVKNRYNYMQALDKLIRNKEIFVVSERPEVFCLNKEAPAHLLKKYVLDYQKARLKRAKDNAENADDLNGDAASASGTNAVDSDSGLKETIQDTGVPAAGVETAVEKESVEEPDAEGEAVELPNKIVVANVYYASTDCNTRSRRKRSKRKGMVESGKDNSEEGDEPTSTVTSTKGNVASNGAVTLSKPIAVSVPNSEPAEVPVSIELPQKPEHWSQLSSSNSELSELEPEVLPDSEIYPSEYIFQKVTEIGFDSECILTRFANWSRSPVSALNEFAQICHLAIKLEITDSVGPDHSKL